MVSEPQLTFGLQVSLMHTMYELFSLQRAKGRAGSSLNAAASLGTAMADSVDHSFGSSCSLEVQYLFVFECHAPTDTRVHHPVSTIVVTPLLQAFGLACMRQQIRGE